MSRQVEIARTITTQIHKNELWAIGAKNFVALSETAFRIGGLQFDASLFGRGRCKVVIELNGKDLYNVTVLTGRQYNQIVAKHVDIFCEDLEYNVVKSVEDRFAALA